MHNRGILVHSACPFKASASLLVPDIDCIAFAIATELATARGTNVVKIGNEGPRNRDGGEREREE